jgi:hypothetical protein
MQQSPGRGAVVEMVRDARAARGRDRFSCTLDEWRALLKLAQDFGWQPLGTTYEVPMRSKIEEPARRDYEPGEAEDRKHVSAEDSVALAAALTEARASPALSKEMAAKDSLRTLISEFTQYAYGGAFMLSRGADADLSAKHTSQ